MSHEIRERFGASQSQSHAIDSVRTRPRLWIRQPAILALINGVPMNTRLLVFVVAAPIAESDELVERSLSIGLDGNNMLFFLCS